ncbi:hypothetical protein [Flagellimonas marina]|uniref:Uncharacterized protein n=1 Tax=Flagellimonas marina TaxID=1775168 RepID=A0ABV8PIQ1_9FLAO
MASDTKKITSSSQVPFITEQLKISKQNIFVRVNRMIGQKDDSWVVYSPSLEVSGYGSSKEEAMETFELDMEGFMDSLFAMSRKEQQRFLFELGWKKSKFFNKQYSKAYIDKDGILQNLDNVSLEAMEFA